MRRKDERSKQIQTNNKAKQHSTPKAATFPKKNELPRVGHVHVALFQALPLAMIFVQVQGQRSNNKNLQQYKSNICRHKVTIYLYVYTCTVMQGDPSIQPLPLSSGQMSKLFIINIATQPLLSLFFLYAFPVPDCLQVYLDNNML